MSSAIITNALVRCTRNDDLAKESFELVRADLGLWVLELPENFQEMVAVLNELRDKLRLLGVGSSDYTLHLAATVDEIKTLKIPLAVTELSADCGFAIEIIASIQ